MNTHSNPDIAALLFRITLGTVLISHSVYLKLVIYTLPGTAQYFSSIGLPTNLAYLVFFAEALGGVAMVLGFKTRLVSLAMVPILVGATWAHWTHGWQFTNAGGGWEYPLVLTALAIAQYFLGGGEYAITRDA